MFADRFQERVFERREPIATGLQLFRKRMERLHRAGVAEALRRRRIPKCRTYNQITNQVVRNHVRVNLFTYHRWTLATQMIHLHVRFRTSDIEFNLPTLSIVCRKGSDPDSGPGPDSGRLTPLL